MAADEEHFDLLGYLSVLWRKKWFVLVLTLLTVGTALALSFLQPTTYTSTSKMLVNPVALNPPGSVPLGSTIDLATEAEVVRSQEVAQLAAQTMSGSVSAGAVLADTSVSYATGTQILFISCSASTASQAAQGANAVSDAYLSNRKQQALDAIDSAVTQANSQIADLQEQATAAAMAAAEAKPGSSAQIDALNQAAQLNGQIAIWQGNAAMLNTMAVDPGRVLLEAGEPSHPASPDHGRDAARALILGLIIGMAAALFVDAVQRRARSA
jgi:uncharacterized protein involved in exopolysaccharide biosynthesis